MNRRLLIGVTLAALVILAGCAQESPAGPKPTRVPPLRAPGPACQYGDAAPIHYIKTTCVELVYDHVTPPEAAPAQMGLAFDPEGTLYIARTATGAIWAVRDQDGDQFMDAPYPVAEGLTLPTALAVYQGSLYVASVGGLLRIDPGSGERTVLVDDLGGMWPQSVQIGPDGRLYTSLSGDPAQPGRLVSYVLDGTGEQIEIPNLDDPADFTWNPGTGELWVVDAERLVSGTGDTVFTFDPQSGAAGIAFYPYDGFPFWQDDLVVALRGSWNRPEPAGYALAVVRFEGGQPDGSLAFVAPTSGPGSAYRDYSLAKFSLTGRGFFPFRPVDVVVSAEGWLYVSVEEGQLWRFRPRPAAE